MKGIHRKSRVFNFVSRKRITLKSDPEDIRNLQVGVFSPDARSVGRTISFYESLKRTKATEQQLTLKNTLCDVSRWRNKIIFHGARDCNAALSRDIFIRLKPRLHQACRATSCLLDTVEKSNNSRRVDCSNFPTEDSRQAREASPPFTLHRYPRYRLSPQHRVAIVNLLSDVP